MDKRTTSEYHYFSWQEGYGVFSVSESNKSAVIDYIANQQAHHRKYTAQEEFELFLLKNGLQATPPLNEVKHELPGSGNA